MAEPVDGVWILSVRNEKRCYFNDKRMLDVFLRYGHGSRSNGILQWFGKEGYIDFSFMMGKPQGTRNREDKEQLHRFIHDYRKHVYSGGKFPKPEYPLT